jgi:hypothetical protein
MTEPMLVSLDVLGTDEELSAAARAAREAGPQDPHAEAEGRDRTRAVTVRMGPSGRVDDVRISNWWRDDLSPSELPEALVDAYRDAVGRTVSAMAGRLPEGAPAPGHAPVQPLDPELDDAEWFEAIRRSNDRTEENLERADRIGREGPPTRVVSGPAGIVRLHSSGGTVTAAEIDVHAALQESPSALAADALAAFQAVR